MEMKGDFRSGENGKYMEFLIFMEKGLLAKGTLVIFLKVFATYEPLGP